VNEYLVPQQCFLSRIFEKFRDRNFDGLERTDKINIHVIDQV